MNIPASDLRLGDVVLGYNCRDIRVTAIDIVRGLVYINPGHTHDMLVLPADRSITILAHT